MCSRAYAYNTRKPASKVLSKSINIISEYQEYGPEDGAVSGLPTGHAVSVQVAVRLASHPAWSTTGSWSKPSLFMMSMASWQLTDGSTVSGVATSSRDTFRSHHLEGSAGSVTTGQRHLQVPPPGGIGRLKTWSSLGW